MVAEACGYQLLCMDAVIAGFERHFPETGVDTYADLPSDTILRHVSGKIAPFLQTVMERGAYDAHGRGMVIDVYQLLPEDFVRCMRPELCDAYYLVSADVTPEERFALLKAFDTRSLP